MIFKFLEYIQRKIGLLSKKDWLWDIETNENNHNWKNIPTNKGRILSSQKEVIVFKSRESLLGGWYLFGIKHTGKNSHCFGSLSSGRNGMPQSRPMFPVRRRWRVVRIKRNKNVYLRLNNISEDLLINELWLIPLCKTYAFLKIKKRINSVLGLNFVSINKMNNKKLWKEYNKLLLSQKNKKRYINYYYWQEEVERNAINKILSIKEIKKLSNREFVFQNDKEISLVKEETFVITKKSSGILSEYALDIFSVVLGLNKNCLLIYPDEDCINENKKRHSPNFKPAWNRELFFADPSYSNCWVIRSDLWNLSIKKLKERFLKFTINDVVLEVVNILENNNNSEKILHVPFICYHKLTNKNNIQRSMTSKAAINLENYINKYFSNIENRVKINPNKCGYKISWVNSSNPLLSIIIPTKDKVELLSNCIKSIEEINSGIRYEIIIVDNGSNKRETLDYFKSFKQNFKNNSSRKVLRIEGEFNYSHLNNFAVKKALGDVLLLLNNDVEIISNNWGMELVSNALRDGIGCVGAKLLFKDETIQHGGVILGVGGVAGHAHKYFSKKEDGFQRRINLQQEISAVTGAFLAISKKNWEKLGGMDSENLKVNYNDVDLCLKALNYGLKNIYNPNIVAYHFESKTRGKPIGLDYRNWKREYNFMKKKWNYLLLNDPSYSPHLSLKEEDFSLHLQQLNVLSRSYNKIRFFDDINC